MKWKVLFLALVFGAVSVGGAMAQSSTIYETLKSAGNFNKLITAMDKANVGEVKQMTGPFTVFAFNDAAFAKLPQDTQGSILGDEQIAKNVVYYHIIPGKYLAKDLPGLKECKTLCPTGEGQIINFTKMGDKYMVGSANIVKADILASNGVIHEIDTVLIPKSAPPKVP